MVTTPEETALYQRMVNAINRQVDQEEDRKEEVKQLKDKLSITEVSHTLQ